MQMSKNSDYEAIKYFSHCHMNFLVIHLLANNRCSMFLIQKKNK